MCEYTLIQCMHIDTKASYWIQIYENCLECEHVVCVMYHCVRTCSYMYYMSNISMTRAIVHVQWNIMNVSEYHSTAVWVCIDFFLMALLLKTVCLTGNFICSTFIQECFYFDNTVCSKINIMVVKSL